MKSTQINDYCIVFTDFELLDKKIPNSNLKIFKFGK